MLISLWRHIRLTQLCALTALVPTLAGCYDTHARYYFATADLADHNNPKLTFYRITITADSFNTTANYQSGFYSASALHQLYGEVKKPTAGDTNPYVGGTGEIQLLVDPASGNVAPARHDDRFTLIYGANADAVAQQIQSFADADQTGAELSTLIAAAAGGSQLDALAAAQQQASVARKTATDLADKLDALAKKLDPASSDYPKLPSDAYALLIQALQDTVDATGSGAKLTDANDKLTDPATRDRAFDKAKTVYDTLNAPAK